MNHDENNSNLHPWIEPELEARLVAVVLGEASAFEAAEIARLVEEKPELALLKRRIEAVHGLIGLATRPDQAPMRLAPERRAKILAAIGGTVARPAEGEANAPVLLKFAERRRKRRRRWIWSSAIAASLSFAAIVMLTFVPSDRGRFGKERAEVLRMEMPALRLPSSKEDDESVVLSPFEITSAGTQADKQKAQKRALEERENRIDLLRQQSKQREAAEAEPNKVEISDQAAAVSVVTPEFMRDVGATTASRPVYSSAPKVGAESNSEQVDVVGKAAGSADAASSVEPAIVLSPLVVNAPEDTGYRASSTLAGTRLRTDLKDIAASIQLNEFAPTIGSGNKVNYYNRPAGQTEDDFLANVPVSGPAAESKSLGGSMKFAAPLNNKLSGLGSPAGAPPPTSGETPAAIDAQLTAQKPAQPAAPAESVRLETSAQQTPVSTFSLHVSDASFRLAQAALARGERPDPATIRPEEFYNAFDYSDPSPSPSEKIGCRIEQSAHPLLQQRNLVRIAMKVPALGRAASQPLHLTVLLDTSGSMEREDRVASVQRAFTVLASLLTANDRVTLIGFARQPRLLVEDLPGNEAATLVDLAKRTPFTGGTNVEEALKLAGELAARHHDAAAQNRIVLLTDGAANLGNADPAQLAASIEKLRQQHIAFDACGVGTEGLDDSVLEALTRKGDGRYYVLDKPEDADAGFARQLAGAFRPAAENVKVQVRFNPARVGRYRLIGFEHHRLREEDFRNDAVDAAELAADEAAVALYQVEVLPEGDGELGDVFVRFRDPADGRMVERSWTMLHEAQTRTFDRATPSLQLAGLAALLAEKLRDDDQARLIDLDELLPVANALRGSYANAPRVQQLLTMFDQMRRQQAR
jgi:secreted protein with Ig-like and vWFA domain